MRSKLRLVEITQKYIGAPYRLGGSNRREGFDCFRLALSFWEELGAEIPDSFQGQTLETYPELWERDPVGAKRIMLNLFAELGNEVNPKKAFVTDILILKDKSGDNVGINVGNGLVMTVYTDAGVQVSNVRRFEVERAYRWVAQGLDI